MSGPVTGSEARAGATGAAAADVLVFAPTFNEHVCIGEFLNRLLALPVRCDILIVDDASTDGTRDVLDAFAAREPRLRVIYREGKSGVGSAHKLAWSHARARGYGRIVTLDADLSHDPEDVPRLLALLDAGADVAIGSRFVEGGRVGYTGWRLWASHAGNIGARTLLALPLREYTTSLRAARLDRVPAGLIESVPNDGYGFFLTCAVRLAQAKRDVRELPIVFHDRRGGVSKISAIEIVRAMVNLLRLAIEQRRGHW